MHQSGPRDEEGRLALAVSDAEGRYEAAHLPEVLCTVRRQDEWQTPGVVRHAILPEDDQTATLDIGGPARVFGRLLVNGKPAANVELMLGDDRSYYGVFRANARTDADGAFAFYGIPQGERTLTYTFEAQRGNRGTVKRVQVTAGDVDLGTINHLEGKVVVRCEGLDHSSDAEPARITLNQFDSHWISFQEAGVLAPRSGDNAPYVFEHVPPGKYEVTSYRQEWPAVRQVVEVTSEKMEPTVTLRLPTGTATVRCQVDRAVSEAEGSIGALKMWNKDRTLMTYLLPKEEGMFAGAHIPAGDYVLTKQDVRNFDVLAAFSVKDGETKTVEINSQNVLAAVQPRGFLQVRVLTPDGVPLPGCEIQVAGPQDKLTPTSAQSGVVTWQGKPGNYDLSVSYPGFEPLRQTVEVKSVNKDRSYGREHELRLRLKPAAP
jgi:hypothetical protein